MRRWALLATTYLTLTQLVTAAGIRSSVSGDDNGKNEREARRLASGPSRPWIDPPSPRLSGRVWNATNLRWLGRSYYFEDEPTYQQYTPHQIQQAFRKHSVLMIGDSTIRRFYGTLHGILSNDVVKGISTRYNFPRQFRPNLDWVLPVDLKEFRQDLVVEAALSGDVDALEEAATVLHAPLIINKDYINHRLVIDVNKGKILEPCHKNPPACEIEGSVVNTTTAYQVCRPYPSGGWETPKDISGGRPSEYDYVSAACIPGALSFLESFSACGLQKDYSLLVVGAGVWETTSKKVCMKEFGKYYGNRWPQGMYNLVNATLTKLAELQSPQFAVVWRTSAFYDGDRNSGVIMEMNRRAIAFIDEFNANQRPVLSNLTYMDWGKTMETKSHGAERLSGDMKAHYALEARVLQVQMLTNIMYERNLV